MNVSTIQEYFADLNHGWTLIITIFAASFIISLIFMIFIRYCAGCFVWLFIIGFLLTLAAIGLFFFFIDSTEFLQEMFHYESFPSNLKDRNYQIAIGSVCAFLFVVTFLILICFKKQIQICNIIIIKQSESWRLQLISPKKSALLCWSLSSLCCWR